MACHRCCLAAAAAAANKESNHHQLKQTLLANKRIYLISLRLPVYGQQIQLFSEG